MVFRRSQIIVAGTLLAIVLLIALPLVTNSVTGGERQVAGGLTIVLWLFLATLLLAALAIVYAIVCGSNRKDAGSRLPVSVGPHTFPRRRNFLILTLSYLVFVAYGSLVPFQFQKVAFASAWNSFWDVGYMTRDPGDKSDWVANILLSMPLGYFALGTFAVDCRGWLQRWGAVLPVVVMCTVASAAIEFAQIWVPIRTCSLYDILCQSIGAVIGSALWLALGQATTDWVRRYASSRSRRTQVDRLLEFYMVGLVVYSLLPLEPTINKIELIQKYRSGMIVLIPFSEFPSWGLQMLFNVVTDMAIFVPVGMYVATAFTTARRPLRSLLASAVAGAAVAATIEFAQIFIETRFSSVTQIITETTGAVIGAAIVRRWRVASLVPRAVPSADTVSRRAWLYFAAAGAYSLALVPIFCAQGHWLTDPAELGARFAGFWRTMPFTALYFGSEFNATNQVLRKTLFFAPLGVLATLGIASLRPSRTMARLFLLLTILYAVGVGFSIEMLKVMLPPHCPDMTDLLFASIAAGAGAAATWKAIRADDQPTPS